MARGITDVVEVVVLAARAHALLRRRGPWNGARLLACEHVLELHHAGVGEHQGRVVARHERRGGDDLVAVLLEVVEEGGADFADGCHRCRSFQKRVLPGVPPQLGRPGRLGHGFRSRVECRAVVAVPPGRVQKSPRRSRVGSLGPAAGAAHSIAARGADGVQQRRAGLEPGDFGQDRGRERLRITIGRVVRCHGHVR